MSTPAERRITLEDVEKKARADLKTGGPDAAIDWAFRHARAVARLAEAEQAWKTLDADRYRLQLVNEAERGEYDTLVLVTQSLHGAAADLGAARSIEVACAHVLRLLEKSIGRGTAVVAPAVKKAA